MADKDDFDGSTDDLLAEIRKMEKEKEELEKKNKDRQQLEHRLKQLKGNVSSLKSGKNSSNQSSSRTTSETISSDSALNTSLEESQARLRALHETVLRSPRATTSLREAEDFNRSYEEFEDDVMTEQHKQALRENRDVLVENMTPDDIFNDLISKRILSNADVSRIKERNTVEAINEELLNIIVRRSDRAFTVLCSSLRRTLQGWLANRLDPVVETRGKRKRRPGEVNVDVECERVLPQSKKRYTCTCREVEEQILTMAKVAFLHIRRRDGTAQSFEQFKKELHQTNEAIRDSMEILHSLKVLCRHGDLSDLSEGSVRFTIRCSSFASCQRLWEDYMSGKILQAVEKSIITPSLLKICGAKRISLRVRISKLEYLTCALELGEEQRKLMESDPFKQRTMFDITQRRTEPRRICTKMMGENRGNYSSSTFSNVPASQPERVLRKISPNIQTTVESSEGGQSQSIKFNNSPLSPYLCAQSTINISENYPTCNSLKENKHNYLINSIDMSHIFPFSTNDLHHVLQCETFQHSPVYKTRSKSFIREVSRKTLVDKNVLLSKRRLKFSLSCGYNLRCRSIRT